MDIRNGDVVALGEHVGVVFDLIEREENAYDGVTEWAKFKVRWLGGGVSEHSEDEAYNNITIWVVTMPDGTDIEYRESDRIRDYVRRLERESGKHLGVGFRYEPDPESLQVITPKRFVNVYLHDRAYGGPEEGGWWFDYWEPQEEMSHEFETEEAAEKFLEDAEAEADDENAHRRSDIGSVLSDGAFEVRLEAWPGEHRPKHRPRYC